MTVMKVAHLSCAFCLAFASADELALFAVGGGKRGHLLYLVGIDDMVRGVLTSF